MSLIIRSATADDLVWVRCSWLSSYRDHTAHRVVRQMPGGEYGTRWRRTIARLLDSAHTLVCAHSDAPDTVLGWLCYEDGDPPRIHYVHVRREVQRRHIARDLLDAANIDPSKPCWYSHRTTCSDLVAVPSHWEWQPWLVIGV